jgi:hypothetical protein
VSSSQARKRFIYDAKYRSNPLVEVGPKLLLRPPHGLSRARLVAGLALEPMAPPALEDDESVHAFTGHNTQAQPLLQIEK